MNSVLLGETLPKYLDNLSFNNLKLKLGPEFKLHYSEIVQAYLDTKLDLTINGEVGKDLNARGLIYLKKGRANLYTTPFKLDKNKGSSPSVSEASHGRYLSLFTRSMSADTILREEDQSEEGE